jgi:protein TonB
MRSSFFVLLSLFVHALCVAAIAITPSRVSPPEGDKEIEVQVGEPAEQPGVEQAPAGQTEAAAPVTPPPAPVEETKPVTVAKAATRKTRVVKAPMEKVTETKPVKAEAVDTKITELPAKEAVAETSEDKLDPEIADQAVVTPPAPVSTGEPEFIPVKESAPAGVEAADEDTEAGSQDAKGEDPAPAPVKSEGENVKEDAGLAQGGATKAGAVSYLDLKQAPGNKSPQYPMRARREQRQGQVELLYRVTREGKVSDLQIAKSSGYKDLDQEAARAVSQFKFVPGQEGWARHPVAFTLKGIAAQAPSRLRSAQTE